MSFPIVSLCVTNPEVLEDQHKLQLLPCEKRMALITDVFLAALAIAVAILVILSCKGINLGELSGIGSLGVKAAYILIGAASGVILVDGITLLVQMARHISRLLETITSLRNQTADRVLEAEKSQLAQTKAQLEGENEALKAEKEQSDSDLKLAQIKIAQVEDLSQQLEQLTNQSKSDLKLAQIKIAQVEELSKQTAEERTKKTAQETQRLQDQIQEQASQIDALKGQLTKASEGAEPLTRNRIQVVEKENLELKTK